MKMPIIAVTNQSSGYNINYADGYGYGSFKNNTFCMAGSHSCREEFLRYRMLNEIGGNSYWFLLNIGTKGSVNEYRHFLKAAEKSIGVKNTILVRSTNMKGVVAINVNSWWLKSKIRMQFITCLLRCYYHYNKNNHKSFDKKNIPMDNILFSYPYFSQTKPAVQRFMSGFTLLKKGYKCEGWLNRFNNTKTNPEKCLVKIDAGEADSNMPLPINVAEQLGGASVL